MLLVLSISYSVSVCVCVCVCVCVFCAGQLLVPFFVPCCLVAMLFSDQFT